MQGATGDCWFLSSISALAEKRPLADRVINPTANSTAAAQEGGIYKFQFYRMGEWHDVIIDDQIPLQYSARPENGELWVPLLEKAYAKFFGNYHNIVGGDPVWALFNLTGGLTVDVKEFKGLYTNIYHTQDYIDCSTPITTLNDPHSTTLHTTLHIILSYHRSHTALIITLCFFSDESFPEKAARIRPF